MGYRFLKSFRTFGYASALVMAIVAVATIPIAGQTATTSSKAKMTGAKKTWTQPRTPDGQPDLQGIWSNATTTPLERPSALAGKQVLTDEETAELEKQTKENRNTDHRQEIGTEADVASAYNEAWWDRGPVLNRTSLIIDPADGRLPLLTQEGKKTMEARAAARRAHGPADSWEDRSLQERCILYHGVPPLPTGYNNNYQIVQTPGYVSILHEEIHEIRMIPLDGRPHLPSSVRLWMGDSRGHWDGNTLVVETTNFMDRPNLFRFPASVNIQVIERFTRVDADHIDYRFTINDPFTYQKSWTAILPMTKIAGPIYEYACHEGNYGIVGILAGARAQEKAAAEAAKNPLK
jgi:hypothetical protein